MNNNIELLAPAGTPAAALAALDAGADAVYAGLSRFNARERGENFTPEAMGKIIEHFHRHNRKVYVTFNTLLKESELPAAFEQLVLLNQLKPDALLVQDPGVISMVRKYFPGLALHGSTQMGFHNSAGIAVAEKLGLTRVVLERQVTMEELAAIKKKSSIELEVFIHGALCCSLSGCCYFSSYLGGYSGNRGKCKQPCRRRYFSSGGNGFFFSPQDLCAMELIPELRNIGVASLKIEGRLRQTDYVTAAVSAYRMLLDAPESEFKSKLPEARKILSGVGGRRWSHGFYSRSSTENLIRPDAVGSAGKLCGTVEAVRDNGFGFTATSRLFIGDRIRIQPGNGEEGPAMTLTKFFVENLPASRVLAGQRVFVCCDKKIPLHGQVFKLGGNLTDYSGRLAALPPRRNSVDLNIIIEKDFITVNVQNGTIGEWRKTLDLAPAKSRALSPEQVCEVFRSADSGEWCAGNIDTRVGEGLFIPASELKEIRREVWDHLKANLNAALMDNSGAMQMTQFMKDYSGLTPLPFREDRIETAALKPKGEEPANRKAIRSAGVFEFDSTAREVILPEFIPENKLNVLEKAIERAINAKIRKFRVTSLYGFTLLKKYEGKVEITVSTPLPVANSQAVLMMQQLGAVKALAHIELDKESLTAMREKSVLELELYRLGRPALLTTRAVLPVEGEIHDARNQEFMIRFDSRSNLTRVYPKKIHSVPRLPGFHDFFDLACANWRPQETDSFNFERELQ